MIAVSSAPRCLVLKLAIAASLFGLAQTVDAATIVISIQMGDLTSESGEDLHAGSMLQLVKLGANGVFDPIVPGSWVGGDDSIVALPFTSGGSDSDGFTTAGSFDLTGGPDTAGLVDRVFRFTLEDGIFAGDKLGLRWFPTFFGSNNYASTPPALGTPYGEFTRQGPPLNGGTIWVVPNAGAAVTFDPLITQSAGGNESNDKGKATLTVVPEPSVAALLGLAGLQLIWRRRRLRG